MATFAIFNGRFPSQMTSMFSFDIFIVVIQNMLLNKSLGMQ